jgi:hypothetical protein
MISPAKLAPYAHHTLSEAVIPETARASSSPRIG